MVGPGRSVLCSTDSDVTSHVLPGRAPACGFKPEFSALRLNLSQSGPDMFNGKSSERRDNRDY
jgi:hypothetical protein